MAGLAQVILTDHELDVLLACLAEREDWAAARNLDAKLRGVRRTLECGCEGGACDVPGS